MTTSHFLLENFFLLLIMLLINFRSGSQANTLTGSPVAPMNQRDTTGKRIRLEIEAGLPARACAKSGRFMLQAVLYRLRSGLFSLRAGLFRLRSDLPGVSKQISEDLLILRTLAKLSGFLHGLGKFVPAGDIKT